VRCGRADAPRAPAATQLLTISREACEMKRTLFISHCLHHRWWQFMWTDESAVVRRAAALQLRAPAEASVQAPRTCGHLGPQARPRQLWRGNPSSAGGWSARLPACL
jgi:hypothetical protein